MIRLLRQLWNDEAGYILSAEAVTIGALGVAGATVGVGAMSKAVNDELTETAYAIRSLDQSYYVPAQRGCGSWTAGSCFIQRDVEEAQADLGLYIQEQGGTPLDLPPVEPKSSEIVAPELLQQEQTEREEIKDRATQDREEQRRVRQQKREQRRRQRERQEGNTADEATTL